MVAKPMTPEQAMELLEAAPRRIEAAVRGLPAGLLRVRPAEGEWSLNEVLAHLRACADVRGGAIREILAAPHPVIRAMDPRTWMAKTDYPDLDFDVSFAAFRKQREELLAALAELPPEGWVRAATVKGAGKPLERTVRDYAEWVAIHERPHLKQIERTARALRIQ
ncbi:MAG: DinB family protein [Hyphomicrobiales bacterium]